jgi:nucleotide-binding universal stress UspA family protein
MNWEERIRRFGAPGPQIEDRFSETHGPRGIVTESSPAGPISTPGPAGAIVVGVEGSARSSDALALADLLAGLLGGPLVLVHNRPREEPPKFLEPPQNEQLMRSVSDSTSAQVQELVSHDHEPGMRVTHAESPAEGLRQIAERANARLIVVGPSHRSELGRVRPGSVGGQLLSGAPVPIAIAPRGYADAAPWIGLIASAFDGSPESRLALDWAAQVAESKRRRLRVVSVHSPAVVGGLGYGAAYVDPVPRSDLEREQHQAIAAYDGPVECQVADGDPGRMLVETSRDADLLVMGSRGYGPLQAAFLGSVSRYVVRHAACPVVIHPRSAVGQRTTEPSPDHLSEPVRSA